MMPLLQREFRRVELYSRDFGLSISRTLRHEKCAACMCVCVCVRVRACVRENGNSWACPRARRRSVQLARRAVLARSRNHLVQRALQDEEWVLWVDADLDSYPADVLDTLLGANK